VELAGVVRELRELAHPCAFDLRQDRPGEHGLVDESRVAAVAWVEGGHSCVPVQPGEPFRPRPHDPELGANDERAGVQIGADSGSLHARVHWERGALRHAAVGVDEFPERIERLIEPRTDVGDVDRPVAEVGLWAWEEGFWVLEDERVRVKPH